MGAGETGGLGLTAWVAPGVGLPQAARTTAVMAATTPARAPAAGWPRITGGRRRSCHGLQRGPPTHRYGACRPLTSRARASASSSVTSTSPPASGAERSVESGPRATPAPTRVAHSGVGGRAEPRGPALGATRGRAGPPGQRGTDCQPRDARKQGGEARRGVLANVAAATASVRRTARRPSARRRRRARATGSQTMTGARTVPGGSSALTHLVSIPATSRIVSTTVRWSDGHPARVPTGNRAATVAGIRLAAAPGGRGRRADPRPGAHGPGRVRRWSWPGDGAGKGGRPQHRWGAATRPVETAAPSGPPSPWDDGPAGPRAGACRTFPLPPGPTQVPRGPVAPCGGDREEE